MWLVLSAFKMINRYHFHRSNDEIDKLSILLYRNIDVRFSKNNSFHLELESNLPETNKTQCVCIAKKQCLTLIHMDSFKQILWRKFDIVSHWGIIAMLLATTLLVWFVGCWYAVWYDRFMENIVVIIFASMRPCRVLMQKER